MTSLPDALASCARAAALEQRACLLEAVWTDFRDEKRSRLRAMLPAALIPPLTDGPSGIDDYAVDLALAPDGEWRVMRDRVGSHPGRALLEAPLLAVFLPALSRSLLGRSLLLPSWPVWWLRDADTRTRVAASPARFCLRDGLDPDVEGAALAGLGPVDRVALHATATIALDRTVVRLYPDPRDSVRVVGRLSGSRPCATSQPVRTAGVS